MHYYGYDGYGPMMGYWGAGDIFGHILGMLITVAVVLFVLRLIFGRRMHWRHMGQGGFGGFGHSALDILKERYAKGEIEKAEFEEKKKVLTE